MNHEFGDILKVMICLLETCYFSRKFENIQNIAIEKNSFSEMYNQEFKLSFEIKHVSYYFQIIKKDFEYSTLSPTPKWFSNSVQTLDTSDSRSSSSIGENLKYESDNEAASDQ